MLDKLKPCPFCGDEVIETRPDTRFLAIWCDTCWLEMSLKDFGDGEDSTRKNLYKTWNTRS